MWTRKRTLIGGRSAPEDWTVFCGKQACGRVQVIHSPATASRMIWAWSAWCYPAANGSCTNLEEGCALVREAVLAAKGRMSGSRGDLEV